MKLYIRAHDLGVKDIEPITEKLVEYGLDGVQFVAYKALSDVKQAVGSFTSAHAEKVSKTRNYSPKSFSQAASLTHMQSSLVAVRSSSTGGYEGAILIF